VAGDRALADAAQDLAGGVEAMPMLRHMVKSRLSEGQAF